MGKGQTSLDLVGNDCQKAFSNFVYIANYLHMNIASELCVLIFCVGMVVTFVFFFSVVTVGNEMTDCFIILLEIYDFPIHNCVKCI